MNGVKFLLDTNMVIGLLKGSEPAMMLAEKTGFEMSQSAVSQITRMELLGYPKITPHDENMILAFLKECHVSLITESIETKAIELRRSGKFKLPDAIVAATAIIDQLTLLTLDNGMMQGLQYLDYSRYIATEDTNQSRLQGKISI